VGNPEKRRGMPRRSSFPWRPAHRSSAPEEPGGEMNSGMIGKIEKAHRYAEERDRFRFTGLSVTVRGNNGDHQVRLDDEGWRCSCDFFDHHQECAHTMALEVMLDGMVPVGVHV
jgi:hypothetical protein